MEANGIETLDFEFEQPDLSCKEKQVAWFSPVSPLKKSAKRARFASTPNVIQEQSERMDTEELSTEVAVPSAKDLKMLTDIRVVERMIESEKYEVVASNKYLRMGNVTEDMRKILLRWMFEVIIIYYPLVFFQNVPNEIFILIIY